MPHGDRAAAPVPKWASPGHGRFGMRRLALILALAVFAMGLSGCCWNWSDPIHPRVCPKINPCDGCGPCSTRSTR